MARKLDTSNILQILRLTHLNRNVHLKRYRQTHEFFFFQAQAPDDLTVKRGDWVYADLNNQTVDGWLWTYAPKTRKYGFIPRAYAKPPAMTSL